MVCERFALPELAQITGMSVAFWRKRVATPGIIFTAKVRVAGRTGQATSEPKGRTICVALAGALGIEVEAIG